MPGADNPMPHFVLVPFMAQGHMIPMIDLAKLLAHRGALVSVITTPVNANRFRTTIDHARASGLPIRLVQLPFPCKQLGLPEGCENLDIVPSVELMANFFRGLRVLSEPLRLYLQEQRPYPTCMIVDILHSWTMEVANRLQIPRLSFFSVCCFTLLCIENVDKYNVHNSITDDNERFLVPGLAERIEVTKAQVPLWFKSSVALSKYGEEVREAERMADGIVVNTFEGLELSYIESYGKVMEKKVWSVGPFSLCNKDVADMAARGNRVSVDANQCLSWLDGMKPRSVVYVSFGSLASPGASQLTEIGLGLEASDRPFVWVIKKKEDCREVDEFEDRIGSRGLIIRGWAPQVMILSHPAVGGFMTHCGWNSTLESIVAGVPMVTWPHFGDQFLNERLIVDVLNVGVSVGVSEPSIWVKKECEDDKGKKLAATRDDVEKATRRVMDGGEEGEGRRIRARELGRKARESMKEGGCSHANMTDLIHHFQAMQNMFECEATNL